MSVSMKSRAIAIAAGLGLCAAYAVAQVNQPIGQPVPPAQPGQPSQFGQPSQPGQAMPTERMQNMPRTTTGTIQAPPTARGEAADVDQFFAACMLTKNQCEIEMARFAAERAQNPQVKQFAQTLINDHSQLLPKLQQLAGSQPNPLDAERTRMGGLATGVGADRDPANQPSPTRQSTTTGTTGQTSATSSYGQAIGQTAAGGDTTVQKLIAIDKQIAERAKESFHEKLQQKQGAEFDECFVGAQIVGHMQMLAALDVLKNQSAGQLKQIAQEAEPKVRQHLQEAEKLAEQLRSSSTKQTEAASRPTEGTPRVPR